MTRIAFLGTPEAAIPTLTRVAGNTVVVVTRPDRPRGRSKKPKPSPVKLAAQTLGIEVVQPPDAVALEQDLARRDLDVAVVVAYGMLLPRRLLSIPRHGFVNVHFSLLPRWRGASPVEHAILAGDEETGVSVMILDEGMDTGPILDRLSVPIGSLDAADLTEVLALKGASLLERVLEPYLAGTMLPQPQDDALATYAPRLKRADTRLDPKEPAIRLERVVRASVLRGGAHCFLDGRRLKVWRAEAKVGEDAAPGILKRDDGAVAMGTGKGSLLLIEVQPEGRRRMMASEWARGRRDPLGVIE